MNKPTSVQVHGPYHYLAVTHGASAPRERAQRPPSWPGKALLRGLCERSGRRLARLRRLTLLRGAQFAFLAFLMGHSLEGFGQWKALLALALGCEAAPLGPRARLYRRLLHALASQLALCLGPEPGSGLGSGSGPGSRAPGPLGLPLAEELLADSFLRRLFMRFFEAMREGGARAAPIQVRARHWVSRAPGSGLLWAPAPPLAQKTRKGE